MREDVRLDAGDLIQEISVQLRRNSLAAGGAIAFLVAANLVLDATSRDGSGSFALAGFLSMVTQYFLTRRALEASGLLPAEAPARFGSFWGMNIISGFGLVLAFLLLIIPGLYVAARWLIAGPVILAEDKSATEGLGESWQLTRESAWHIAGATAVLYVVGFGAGMFPLFFYIDEDAPVWVQAFSYLLLSATSVLAWLMAVGAYRLIAETEANLEEVFA